MKKNFFYAMMSAIALTGAIGFTACSSDSDAVVENNPTYDGTSVRTDFAFSVTKASEGTRMTAAAVQNGTSNPFLGIKDMFLLPFDGEANTGTGDARIDQTNANSFYLGELTTSDINDNVIDRNGSTSSKVYSLTLPIGTDNFLFYGTANNSGTNFAIGSLTRNGLPVPTSSNASGIIDIDDINFSLNSIATNLGNDATNIAAYLTEIAKAEGWKGTTTTAKTDGSYQALSDLYKKFTSNAAPRAGSAEGVVRTVLDLYKSAKAINDQSSVSGVKTIAEAILAKINADKNGVMVTVNATDSDPDNWTATATGFNESFPSNLSLPMGAAQLQWTVDLDSNDPDACSYKTSLTSFGGPSNAEVVNTIAQYRYPAELIYFDNSPLLATDKYQTPSAYPTTAANWDLAVGTSANGFSSDWNKYEVQPSTRAVAMRNNVNYGVALLESKISLSGTSLTDNRKVLSNETTNQTDIDGTKFVVTGLLIGGQPEKVYWDMTNPNDNFDDIIYDQNVQYHGTSSTPLGTGYSASNYTIVLDNYANKNSTTEGAAEDQKPVLIALEIKNGDVSGTNAGKDFYGHDGLIPAGSTFYLVGTLNPATGTTGTTGYTRPDYRGTSSTYRVTKEGVQRVFMQDYRTVASITINAATALQKAYSTIPDLRSTEVLFGLNIDTTWEKGVEFGITIQ